MAKQTITISEAMDLELVDEKGRPILSISAVIDDATINLFLTPADHSSDIIESESADRTWEVLAQR